MEKGSEIAILLGRMQFCCGNADERSKTTIKIEKSY